MKPLPGPYLLVVDDDPDIRETLRLMLDMDGWQVADAGDGAEALALLRGAPAPPCLILLDLMMPVMNGEQFLEIRRDDPDLARIPVVVLTGATVLGEEVGEIETIRKPVDLPHLLATVRRLCGAPRPRR